MSSSDGLVIQVTWVWVATTNPPLETTPSQPPLYDLLGDLQLGSVHLPIQQLRHLCKKLRIQFVFNFCIAQRPASWLDQCSKHYDVATSQLLTALINIECIKHCVNREALPMGWKRSAKALPMGWKRTLEKALPMGWKRALERKNGRGEVLEHVNVFTCGSERHMQQRVL